jgi:hypothetical protein
MNPSPFELRMTPSAEVQIGKIMGDRSKLGLQKQLKKAFRHLSNNPRHPGLQSHLIPEFEKVHEMKVFSSYVQNKTPQAHSILWSYGPNDGQLTILAVIPHY